jgi:hypothetical protein
MFKTLAVVGAIMAATLPLAPAASAAGPGCTDYNGYRNCRSWIENSFVSVTAYPGIVKAARNPSNGDVWIDSNQANHLAAGGQGYTEYRPSRGGLKYRACAWFSNPITHYDQVYCTSWVQGF